MNKKITLIIIIAVLVAGGMFFGAYKYGEHAQGRSQFGGQESFNRNGQPRNSAVRGGNNAGFTAGKILNKDNSSISISLQNGGSRIIFISTSTPVLKSVSGSLDDLEPGQNVLIQGSPNSDGSLTAQSIQIRSDNGLIPGPQRGQ